MTMEEFVIIHEEIRQEIDKDLEAMKKKEPDKLQFSYFYGAIMAKADIVGLLFKHVEEGNNGADA